MTAHVHSVLPVIVYVRSSPVLVSVGFMIEKLSVDAEIFDMSRTVLVATLFVFVLSFAPSRTRVTLAHAHVPVPVTVISSEPLDPDFSPIESL